MHIPEPPDVSFWDASPRFRELCARYLSTAAYAWAEPRLQSMGLRAAREVSPLAWTADREPPRLRGNVVEYHPSYREMEEIAYGSGMIAIKYREHEHRGESPFIGYAIGYLFAMAEAGLYCPLCMTDGVARVISRHGTADQIARVVPHLTATDRASLWTGGMFLTERAGGSDVGANETTARRDADGTWRLNGQKWFCSNVDAEAVLVTARPEGAAEGTRGLRTFLMLTRGNDGVIIERLKEKLGVRSMPTGEVMLRDAVAEEIGDFRAMAEMLNLSRLYNAVASVAVIGRAIHEARWYAERRRAFGRAVSEHPLAQETLRDLEAEHAAALALTFDAVDALRAADAGDAAAALRLRILTPIAKAVTGKLAVPCVSESMELIGGNGYIEEHVMPRLLRDAQVLPIWEGTTNILVLDTMRAAQKERAHEPMLARIGGATAESLSRELENLEERNARRWVDRLARAYQLALCAELGWEDVVERLRARPLGLIPGAKL
ncbi:MAG: acyl-CoA dehydrogenase domain protein [Acidobacteria bacterium]|nr:acyl-CoA dehydrogenase domain protein [Acidobacteriota bacterium]